MKDRNTMDYPGLDDAFLRYINATPENQRRIQSFYLPFFTHCQGPVVDLACGHGDFVHMLAERGVEALGVDSDPDCCAELGRRGLKAVCSDVLAFLDQVEENSLDGVFSAHLVEHLPYRQVMELIRRSYRALRPGGVLLLVTPNVRGLFPHLESFYMHFGHVTFYHPRLLGFFMDYFGFTAPHAGENPRMAQPLWRGATWVEPREAVAQARAETGDAADPAGALSIVRYDPRLVSGRGGPLGRLITAFKTALARLFVQPLLDRVVEQVNRSLYHVHVYVRQLNDNLEGTHRRLMELDRPVECYVYGTKGETDLHLPPELVGERL